MKMVTIAAVAFALSGGAVSAAPQQVVIAVGDLICPACPWVAGQAMEKVATVEIVDAAVDWDAERATYLVRFDDAATDAAALIAAVEHYGYSAGLAAEAEIAAAGF